MTHWHIGTILVAEIRSFQRSGTSTQQNSAIAAAAYSICPVSARVHVLRGDKQHDHKHALPSGPRRTGKSRGMFSQNQ